WKIIPPTTTTTSTSTTTTVMTTGRCVPQTCGDGNVCNGVETCDVATNTCHAGQPLLCDDGDRCTDDLCHPRSGCSNTERPPTEPPGVTCRADNMQGILREPPQPVCQRSCPSTIEGRL